MSFNTSPNPEHSQNHERIKEFEIYFGPVDFPLKSVNGVLLGTELSSESQKYLGLAEPPMNPNSVNYKLIEYWEEGAILKNFTLLDTARTIFKEDTIAGLQITKIIKSPAGNKIYLNPVY